MKINIDKNTSENLCLKLINTNDIVHCSITPYIKSSNRGMRDIKCTNLVNRAFC
jgi:hypothetical protein